MLARKHYIERYVHSVKFGYTNKEAFYWENVSWRDVLLGMPVLHFSGMSR